MSGKEQFIQTIEKVINHTPDLFSEYEDKGAAALEYFHSLSVETSPITEKGQIILNYLKENHQQYNNLFKAKDIGEGLGISSHSVTGAIRSLVKIGLVSKQGKDPVMYSLVGLDD